MQLVQWARTALCPMMLAFKVIVRMPDNGELGGDLHAALGGGGPGGKTRNFGDAEAALIRRAAAQQLLESAACFVCIWWAGRKLTLTPVCCPSLWPLVPQGCAVDAGHARLVPVEVPCLRWFGDLPQASGT